MLGYIQATERRLKDDNSCAHESVDVDDEVRKAAAESEGQDAAEAERGWAEAIDVDALDSNDVSGSSVKVEPPALVDTVPQLMKPDIKRNESTGKSSSLPPTSSVPKPLAKKPRIASPEPSKPATDPYLRSDGWTCATCTLDNSTVDQSCQACGQARPAPPGFWTCDFCATSMEVDFRCCRGCGYVRRI